MRWNRLSLTAALVGVAALAATGCVSKGAHRKFAEQNDARLSSVESAVEANERRVADLSRETDQKLASVQSAADKAAQTGQQALSKADAAASAADRAEKGRLLWTVKLTESAAKFQVGKAALPDTAKDELDNLIRQIKSYGRAVYLEIEGHTDATGSESFNQDLGEARAEAVRDYMHRTGGIPLHAISTISMGETSPEADNSTPEGRALNRRVVIRVLE